MTLTRLLTRLKSSDRFLLFVEKKLIKYLMCLLFVILIAFKFANTFKLTNVSFVNKANDFITITMTSSLMDRDSTLITLAAVFIGVYFTAFTLLATLSSKSAIGLLDKNKFNDLLIYCKNAFIASFSYLLISLLSPVLVKLEWFYSSTCSLLLIYMLLSAFRFGWLIYLILKRDVDNFLKKIKEDELESIRVNRILFELEKFLNEEKENKSFDKANEISELLRKRQLEK